MAGHDHWQAVRASVRETGDRFAELVATAPEPGAMATTDWSVAETAAHVTAIAWMYTALARPAERSAVPEDLVLGATLDTVAEFNERTLELFTERDPRALAQRLRTEIGHLLLVTDGLDPARTVTWLGGARVPLDGLLAHLLNELLIHGRDIAVATRSRWPIPAPDAALFFELFLVGLLRNDVGNLVGPAPDRRIAVEFRSRHTTPVVLVLRAGGVTVEEPGGATDVRLSFDPSTLNLMMFHRIGRLRALSTGRVVVSGRRPWLLPAFLRVLRMP
ncbi:DinB family protein [Amycolatopsis nigrescens]|uniref:DinB family protein n=1 Tax=Amycolatopsis nigrescens TaxID=381445 RepID=UPI000369E021|nr:DinB family protein [Amycolatopsis nigrescens]